MAKDALSTEAAGRSPGESERLRLPQPPSPGLMLQQQSKASFSQPSISNLEQVFAQQHKDAGAQERFLDNDIEKHRQKNMSDTVVETSHPLVDHLYFRTVITALVLINTLQMGVEADHPDAGEVSFVLEHFFTAAFFLEMVIKLWCLGVSGYFEVHWNWLDFALVWLACLDTWFLAYLGHDGADLQSLSILRILRLFRLVRVLRLSKNFRQLALVIQGVVDAMHTTFWVACVLALAVYVNAIFFVMMLGPSAKDSHYLYPGYAEDSDAIEDSDLLQDFNPAVSFGNVVSAMLTLFNIAILAEWPEIIWPIALKQPHLVPFFLIFVCFVTFGVMNVIIGMIVDSVDQRAREVQNNLDEMEVDAKKETLDEIKSFVYTLDLDVDGNLDSAKVVEYLEDQFGLSSLSKEVAGESTAGPRKGAIKSWAGAARERLGTLCRRDCAPARSSGLAAGESTDGLRSADETLHEDCATESHSLPVRKSFPREDRATDSEQRNKLRFKNLMDRVELPVGFTPAEFLYMLDRNGDGFLSRQEFIQNFYRLLDSNDFQQRCVMHTVLNELKALVMAGNGTRTEILTTQQALLDAQVEWQREAGARLDRMEQSGNSTRSEIVNSQQAFVGMQVEWHREAGARFDRMEQTLATIAKSQSMLLTPRPAAAQDGASPGAASDTKPAACDVKDDGIDAATRARHILQQNIERGGESPAFGRPDEAFHKDISEERSSRAPRNGWPDFVSPEISHQWEPLGVEAAVEPQGRARDIHEEHVVCFGEGVRQLGIEIIWKAGLPLVGSVQPESPAALQGVVTGDIFVSCNNSVLNAATSREEVLSFLRQRPLRLVVRSHGDRQPTPDRSGHD